MEPNVIIDDGRFKTTAAVKIGKILLHPDWPLGMAARDIEAGEIIEFSNHKDTKDVVRMNDENSNTPKFSRREARLIENCRMYAANDPAGVPSHNLMIIIAKMSTLLIGGELEGAIEDNADAP